LRTEHVTLLTLSESTNFSVIHLLTENYAYIIINKFIFVIFLILHEAIDAEMTTGMLYFISDLSNYNSYLKYYNNFLHDLQNPT